MPNRRKMLSAIVALLALGMLACGMDTGADGPSKPTVEIVSPMSGSRVAVGQELEVHYRATDSVAVVRVELEVERQIVDLQNSPTDEGQPSLTGFLRWTPTTAGVHTLLIYAYNRDGVNSDGVGLEIIVDDGGAAEATATRLGEPPTEPMATVALSDDFSDPGSGWAVSSEDTYRLGYEGGEYFIEHMEQNDASRWQTYPDRTFSDFVAEVEARFEAEDEYVGAALIWRWQDNDNFYRFRIRNTGEYELVKLVDGEWQTLISATSSPHINSGMATNRLKVTAVGDLIQIYVNDQHLADFTDSSFARGRIGFYASVYTASPISTRVFFDNLEVSVSGEEEVAQLTPSPTAPMATLALSDDFDDPDSGWAVTSGEGYGYEGGEYFIEHIGETDKARWLTYPDRTFSDFTAEVEVRFASDVESVIGGLVWRWQDNENFYRLRIYNTGEYDVKKRLLGETQVLIDRASTPHINTGIATNRLKVVALGDQTSIYVNDNHLADFTDSSFNEGRIGFYAGVSAESPVTTRISFDNLRVYVAEAVAQLTPSPTAPMATLAFSDDFDDPDSGWAVTSGEGYGYEGGEYFIEHIGETDKARWVTYPDRTFSDFTAEVQIRFDTDVGDVSGGLVWRWQDNDNFYRVRIYNTGEYEVKKLLEGEPRTLLDRADSPHIVSGTATNALKIVAVGDLIQIYVNDQHLADFTDSSFEEGRIGFYAGVSAESPVTTRISFDNLRVHVTEAVAAPTPTELAATPTEPAGVTPESYPPPLGKIVFATDRDWGTGNSDLYLMNADGSGLTRLTNTELDDSFPSWSPDGGRIAFVSWRDWDDEIYVMNADGSGLTRLTNNPAKDRRPSWSPDGRRIAFYSDRDGNWEIYVMNADGSAKVNITNNPLPDGAPKWSPDGQWIAFHSDRGGDSDVYLMKPDGSQVVNLTQNPATDLYPSWSPDGQRIAFASKRPGNYDIYVMNTDGSGLTRLTDNPAMDTMPVWSPDGYYIILYSDRDGNPEVYLMRSDGSQERNLTNAPGFDGVADWSRGQ